MLLMNTNTHPRTILLGAQGAGAVLPVVDHYSGVPERMNKSLQLQADLMRELGACVMDVTLDCEDGAPVGQEAEHAALVVAMLQSLDWEVGGANGIRRRVAVRVHAVDHPSLAADIQTIVSAVGDKLCHLMIPKVDSLADLQQAVDLVDRAGGKNLPLHVLVESSLGVKNAFDIAAHPRLQSISFGLMDFVSSHNGAIPDSAMGAAGQFTHPLVVRAKLEIAAACHAYGKVPSHCVVTEFKDTAAMQAAAERASAELGYTRMWSIHPAQVRPIIAALQPQSAAVEKAAAITLAAQAADWGPISYQGTLHDRASFRYYWQILEKAHATGLALPAGVRAFFA
jgi:citrate lyase subunit beta/citryl-CoA lyase